MRFAVLGLCAILALACCAEAYTPAALADQIFNLPGAPANLPFNQFGGYLTVNESLGRHMFYWYVEAQKNPATAPIFLWTNGGPGCSGLIGFMTEHGPFRPNVDLNLDMNPYSWNLEANMLYIEAPVGVGFSYSDSKDYATNDARTASENYNAILAFLDKFPEINTNPFYISSESYGGHYMPTLAKYIIDQKNTKLNWRGVLVGNPFTEEKSNDRATYETLWGHQVVPKSLWDQFQDNCLSLVPHPVNCVNAMTQMQSAKGSLNMYALSYPLCSADLVNGGKPQGLWLETARKLARGEIDAAEYELRLEKFSDAAAQRIRHNKAHRGKSARVGGDGGVTYDPCASDYSIEYLNLPQVQAAIHAKTPPLMGGKWAECANGLGYDFSDSLTSMIPVWQYILNNAGSGVKLLVFSGDDDAVCGLWGTQDWVYSLGVPVRVPWHQWLSTSGLAPTETTVGGFGVKFTTNATQAKYAFVTVHGAGHEVPTYKPALALELLDNFINGKWF